MHDRLFALFLLQQRHPQRGFGTGLVSGRQRLVGQRFFEMGLCFFAVATVHEALTEGQQILRRHGRRRESGGDNNDGDGAHDGIRCKRNKGASGKRKQAVRPSR